MHIYTRIQPEFNGETIAKDDSKRTLGSEWSHKANSVYYDRNV